MSIVIGALVSNHPRLLSELFNNPMNALELINLPPLMGITSGMPRIAIGLIDGPIAIEHPDLASGSVRQLLGGLGGACAQDGSAACMHGTFVAGILSAKRGSIAPAICPGCTLLVRPIFSESTQPPGHVPSATPLELATAILECINSGACILNVSAALTQPSHRCDNELNEALDYALRRNVIVVVAAGNQGTIGSTAITRHPWVIPVVAYDLKGRPLAQSNLGSSIGRQGLGAPGDDITSLGANGKPLMLAGTSAAAPFVAGAIALLWSEFLGATAAEIRVAVTQASVKRQAAVVPPLLNAWAAYQALLDSHSRR